MDIRLCCCLFAVAAAGGVEVLAPDTTLPAGESVTKTVTVPELPAGQAPVLRLRYRVDMPGGGGGNYVLGLTIGGRPLVENRFRPRLVNKPPFFDPPGTDYHFAWYSPTHGGWFTNFSGTFEGNWGGTGQDFDSLLDLTGLVTPGRTTSFEFRHLMADLPALTHRDAAPLLFGVAELEGLTTEEIERLRAAAMAGSGIRELAATTELAADAGPGTVEYQLAWTKRPAPPAQVRFDDLSGWRVQVRGDADVSLAAARGPLLWLPQNAAFGYGGGTAATSVQLVPPAPIELTAPFDAANLWLYGALKRGVDRPLAVTALLQDADGAELAIDLGGVTSTYWGLQHGVLPIPANQLKLPARFTGLLLDNCLADGPRTAYLESLTFYQQNRQPLTTFDRPSPPPFPLGSRGLLPPSPPGVTVTAEPLPTGGALVSSSPAGVLRFEVDPSRGCLDGITARWNDGPPVRPFTGGGVLGSGGETMVGELVDSRMDGASVVANWRQGPEAWTARYTLDGRTLVIDVACPDGEARGLTCGTVEGLPDPRPFMVPYLKLSRDPTGPRHLFGGGLFVYALPDVYFSDFSTIDGKPAAEGIGLLGGTRYEALTDGTRNPLRERLLLSVSPHLEDTLPSIPNPPSPNLAELAPYMFVMGSGIQPELWRTLKTYGLDHVIANDFARLFVNDYAEGFGLRWRPHPSLTIDQVQAFRAYVKGLGYKFGAYLDARDVFPLGEQFDENRISLLPNGDLRDGWYGNFHAKPNAMTPTTRAVGEQMAAHYPPECVYLDVHTNLGPFACDYEAGVDLAGTARGTILGNGDSILEARKWYGSTISEGIYRWLYAGVCDLDYAQVHVPAEGQPPLLPDFDLRRIHPLQHGTMMGYSPINQLPQADVNQIAGVRGVEAPEPFYRWVSASLAYGHMLMLGYQFIPPLERTIQLYASMQGLQKEYLTDTVAAVDYHRAGQFEPAGMAFASGGIDLGQVRIRYSRGLTLWVNHHPTETWTVAVRGRRLELPPYGWAADKPGELFAYSALEDGVRADYVECPDYRYLRSSRPLSEGGLTVQGGAWLKRVEDDWRLIPCGALGKWERRTTPGHSDYHKDWILLESPPDRGCAQLVVATSILPPNATIMAELADGTTSPVEAVRGPDGEARLLPSPGVVAWRWLAGER